MKPIRLHSTSFGLGALCTLCTVLLLGAGGESFSPDEVGRLRMLASYVQPDGNLNLGNHKIVMLGSTIYDDGSEGGGLILRGGGNRVQVHGNAVFHDNLNFMRETVDITSNLNLGRKKIILQGSAVYDDGSEGGGLILQGGANRVQVRGDAVLHEGVAFRRDTVDIGANLNLGKKRIVMQGSSIFDDGSEGGGLILQGGANRVQVRGDAVLYQGVAFRRDTIDIGANLNLGRKKIVMQGSSIYDDGSEGGGLIVRGGANRIHLFGQTQAH